MTPTAIQRVGSKSTGGKAPRPSIENRLSHFEDKKKAFADLLTHQDELEVGNKSTGGKAPRPSIENRLSHFEDMKKALADLLTHQDELEADAAELCEITAIISLRSQKTQIDEEIERRFETLSRANDGGISKYLKSRPSVLPSTVHHRAPLYSMALPEASLQIKYQGILKELSDIADRVGREHEAIRATASQAKRDIMQIYRNSLSDLESATSKSRDAIEDIRDERFRRLFPKDDPETSDEEGLNDADGYTEDWYMNQEQEDMDDEQDDADNEEDRIDGGEDRVDDEDEDMVNGADLESGAEMEE